MNVGDHLPDQDDGRGIGYGADPDPEHCYELIKYAIENLDDLKERAGEAAPKIREEYSWRKTAGRIVKCLKD